ncbi:HPP family protein [candidate division KSB1 bacterium]
MYGKTVKDLMLPVGQYATVFEDATIMDAIAALEKAQANLSPGSFRHNAVIVLDKEKHLKGYLGIRTLLKALEPKYTQVQEFDRLAKKGVSTPFILSLMHDLHLWQGNSKTLLHRARTQYVKNVMKPVVDCIDENAPLFEGLHMIIMRQTMSVPVSRNDKVVGILRLADIFTEISHTLKTGS